MVAIICKKDKTETIIAGMKDYLAKNRIIKDIHVVDTSDDNLVLVVSDTAITEERANDWWSGYVTGLKQALE